MSRTVVVRCDAGVEHGFGHLTRCRAIATELQFLGTPDVSFFCHAPADALSRFLGEFGLRFEAVEHETGSALDNHWLRSRFKNSSGRPVLLLDSRKLTPRGVASLSVDFDLVCLDDEQYRNFECRLLVNSNPWSSDQLYANKRARTVLAGAPFVLVDHAFLGARRDRLNIGRVPSILVTMGGEDPDNKTAQVLAAINATRRPLKVSVALGPAFHGHDLLKAAVASSLHDVRIVENLGSLVALALEADLAVSSASMAAYELATAGIPPVLVVLTEHQRPTADFLINSGCGLRAQSADMGDLNTLVSALNTFLEDRKALEQAIGTCVTTFDGMGAQRIAAEIIRIGDRG